MLNRIIRFSLNNRLTVLVASIVILLAGMILLLRTEVDIFPDLNAPTVVVMTEAPGMAPEEVEKMVTYPVETAVNGASGVRRVRSSSSTGLSSVWIEFDWGTDTYRARQIVSEKLSEVGDALPAGVESPTMGPQTSILGEMLIIGLTSDSVSQRELRTIADRTIRPRLLALGGVAQVAVIGGDPREFQIQFDQAQMRANNVSLDEVLEAARGVTENASGGIVYDYGNEYIVKADLNTTNVDEIGLAVVCSDAQRGTVTLADVATITEGTRLPRLGVASVKAKPAVLITVTKQPEAGTIGLTEAIEHELEVLKPTLPAGIEISTDIFRQSTFIDASITNLQQSLMEGALMVIIVLFFFLMNLRTTLISLVALPLSVIIATLVLHFMGYTINTMSLGGIAIAIGSLVDDAIVDVENVYKRLRQNSELPPAERQSRIKVVYHASAEVRQPIFNSSLIIIAGFLPLFFLSGVEGRMLIPLGVSFIVALIASTIVALTVTPVLCSFLPDRGKRGKAMRRAPWLTRKLIAGYRWLLGVVLKVRWLVLLITVALFAYALYMLTGLGRGFLPGFNEGSFTINVSTLPGISLDESNRVGRDAEQLIMSVPEVKTVARKTGRAELDEHSLGVNTSEIEAPYELSTRPRSEVVAELRQKLATIPGVAIEIGQPISHRIDAMLSGTEAQIAIKIFGDDLAQLYAIGQQVKEIAEHTEGLVDVNVEQQIDRPQLHITPKRQMLARYGITPAAFAKAVNVALEGEVVAQVYDNGIPYDLTVKSNDRDRNNLDAIRALTIDSSEGRIPLSAVADIKVTSGPNTINRENVKRRLVVSANVHDRDLRSAVDELSAEVQEQVKLPQNYYIEYGGQFESEAEASRTLMWASVGALLIVLMLLYQEFRRWSLSLIILINMPLAMIGGVLILVFTGADLNIPAIIGFISLLGIATRNGMLLISRYVHMAPEATSRRQLIIEGAADRFLPIVMTALTSALALIPLALRAGEAGNEIQAPLAVVILGGLISSTLLNLLVVPILCSFKNIRFVKDDNNDAQTSPDSTLGGAPAADGSKH